MESEVLLHLLQNYLEDRQAVDIVHVLQNYSWPAASEDGSSYFLGIHAPLNGADCAQPRYCFSWGDAPYTAARQLVTSRRICENCQPLILRDIFFHFDLLLCRPSPLSPASLSLLFCARDVLMVINYLLGIMTMLLLLRMLSRWPEDSG
jgi:hypothetical protein